MLLIYIYYLNVFKILFCTQTVVFYIIVLEKHNLHALWLNYDNTLIKMPEAY